MVLDRAVLQRMEQHAITQSNMAFYFGVTQSAVSQCLKNVHPAEHSLQLGRPSGLTESMKNTIRDTFAANPFAHASDLKTLVTTPCSLRTVERWLHVLELRSSTAILRRYLSPSHMDERLAFAQAHRTNRQRQFMFADEC